MRLILLSSVSILLSACAYSQSDMYYGQSEGRACGDSMSHLVPAYMTTCNGDKQTTQQVLLDYRAMNGAPYRNDCGSGCQVGQPAAYAPYQVNHSRLRRVEPAYYAADSGLKYHVVPRPHAYGHHHAHGHNSHTASYGYAGPRYNQRRGYAYGELGGSVQYNIEDVDYTAGVTGRVGYQSSHIIGAEVELTKGLVSDNIGPFAFASGTEEAKFETDYSAAAFAVARVPVSFGSVYLRGGYHDTHLRVQSKESDQFLDVEEDSYALGGGVEFAIDEASSIRSDTTAYDMRDEGTLWMTSMTYQRKF